MKSKITFLRVRLSGILLIMFLSITSYGKNNVTITVIEKETGDRISFSVISTNIKAISKPIGVTDISGTFSTDELMVGQVISVSSLGYSPIDFQIPDNKTKITLELKKGIELRSVTITASYVSQISCGSRCLCVDADLCFTKPIIRRETYASTIEVTKKNIEQFQLYPNPSHGFIRIKSEVEDYLLEIFDCTGKLVQKFMSANDEQVIELQELKAGIYFCRITKESSSQTSRLVIN